jgi:hypothetical protein
LATPVQHKCEAGDDLYWYERQQKDLQLRSLSMRSTKFAFVLGAVLLISSASVVSPVFSSPTGNDPCKVLTAEKFSQIMGYTAAIDKTASTQMTCFYQGPEHSGGQFMILTETASGPQVDAMLNRRGSTPPPGSGLIGGSYRQGGIIFSVSIRSTDQAKLEALVTEIKHNLK